VDLITYPPNHTAFSTLFFHTILKSTIAFYKESSDF
jgi:hypothetical protein